MKVGAGVTVVGADAAEVVTAGVGGAVDTAGLGFALCLRWGLGRGLSFALSGENCETSSTSTLWTGLTVATGVVFTAGVAARAGALWSTARATMKAAPNAATMQMMAVPARRIGK